MASERYPLHLDLSGRRVLVVGGGPVALRRAQALQAAGARVVVVAPHVTAGMPGTVHERPFRGEDVAGAWLVVTATGAVDDEVARICEQQRVWCVRADDAALSPAWVPAVARVDDVTVSVSAGRDPRRAVGLRDALALALETGELPLRRGRLGTGSVALVGGGPGDPGLLTVRGRRLLAGADVVVRDRLAPQVPLPDGVEVVEVGKGPSGPSWRQQDIDALLVSSARAGRRVVRLKGGDPFVFGRGSEEAEALVAAGIDFEVVPGVSSAIAAPAYAGIPVTARGYTQDVCVVTGHLDPDDPASRVRWQALATGPGTLVILMGHDRLALLTAGLVRHGRSPATPAACIERGTTKQQRVVVSTLERLAHDVADAGLQPPVATVVGEVVRLRERLSWFA